VTAAAARWIGRYFERTRSYSTPRFIIELALVPFPVKAALGMIMGLVADPSFETTTDALAEGGIEMLMVGGLILAPLIETVIGQWLPIWLLSYVTRSEALLVAGSAFLFALQHLHVGIPGVVITFPIGVILSWSFLAMRKTSRSKAYWVTTAIHAGHNALAIGLYLAAGS
jgi:hypothetical protein